MSGFTQIQTLEPTIGDPNISSFSTFSQRLFANSFSNPAGILLAQNNDSTTIVTNNINSATAGIVPTINAHTDTQTAAVTSNTATNINVLKATDTSTAVTISSGTSYQTVFSRSGQGIIKLVSVNYLSGGGVMSSAIKLTIDGTIYAEKVNSPSTTNYEDSLLIAPMSASSNPYYFVNGTTATPTSLLIQYKTSVLVEAYSNGTTRQVKYHNSNLV